MKVRLQWIDTSKVLAILIILFVHLIESMYDEGTQGLLPAIKFFHAFLLFFFFLTTGFFMRPKASRFMGELGYRFLVRIVPVLAFALLLLPFNAVLEHNVNIMQHGLLKIALMYLVGLPVLAWTTWFLVALFVAELICYFFPPTQHPMKRLVAAIALYAAGWWLAEMTSKSVYILSGVWFFREALIISAILLVGSLIKPLIIHLSNQSTLVVFSGFLICFLITFFTYDLNQITVGPESHRPIIVDRATVIMALGRHGDWFWFMFTGLIGGLMCVFGGMLLPSFKPIPYLAQHSLLLLGLIGFYLHFVNNPLAVYLADLTRDQSVLVAVIFSLLQLLLCIPAIWLLNKYLPQLFGQPNKTGPILPALARN